MPTFPDPVEIRRPWSDWLFLRQERDVDGGGGFHVHNPWGNSKEPQGSGDRNRLEIAYRTSGGQDQWGQVVLHGPSGNIGLGMVNPRARLHVNGSVIVTGDIALQNADLAEWFRIAGDEPVEPGAVMVLDEDETLRQSTEEYDRKVAGVVSGAGTYRPGIVLDDSEDEHVRVTVALVGKVFCKATARPGAIAVGDLLTTSATPGHAMRAKDRKLSPGATLGKALRPLEHGSGLIPVLVALQ